VEVKVKKYANSSAADRDARRMTAQGWQPQGMAGGGSHFSLGKGVTNKAMASTVLGPLGLLASSRKEQPVTITWTRTPEASAASTAEAQRRQEAAAAAMAQRRAAREQAKARRQAAKAEKAAAKRAAKEGVPSDPALRDVIYDVSQFTDEDLHEVMRRLDASEVEYELDKEFHELVVEGEDEYLADEVFEGLPGPPPDLSAYQAKEATSQDADATGPDTTVTTATEQSGVVGGSTADQWIPDHESIQQTSVETAAASASIADELAKLAQLRDSGALTDTEFAALKSQLIKDFTNGGSG
jgi:hypothetical protein